ncbi:MAG: hypothetical protein ACFWTZ_07165 [Burkholderia sp.]|jgi:uncharacterized membrane protein
MTDPSKFQPKDGDFVTYIEKIQKESERNLARGASVPRPNTDEARTLRDMAGELYRQSAADKADKEAAIAKAEAQAERLDAQVPSYPEPEPEAEPSVMQPAETYEPPQAEAPQRRRSVADEFRNAPAPASSVPRRPRKQNRAARALGILLLFTGAVLFISCLQAGLDDLVPIAFFLIFAGFVFVQIGSKR